MVFKVRDGDADIIGAIIILFRYVCGDTQVSIMLNLGPVQTPNFS